MTDKNDGPPSAEEIVLYEKDPATKIATIATAARRFTCLRISISFKAISPPSG